MSELKIINRKNINFNPIDDHIYKALINLKNKTINMHLSKNFENQKCNKNNSKNINNRNFSPDTVCKNI